MGIGIGELQAYKNDGRRFAMLTAYDYTTARIVAKAGIPVILVGDSLGMMMLGYSSTLPVRLEEMLHHARAVARGAPGQLLVGDMPFNSYHSSDEEAIANAAALLQAGMQAVKVEGGGRIVPLAAKLVERGIPVMGHLGLTPQFVNIFGGYRVQGKSESAAERIYEDSLQLQEAGAFALVLEGMPRSLAQRITAALRIPTIGIGAGPDCDGQVLVIHDLLGLNQDHVAKFVKSYASLGAEMEAAIRAYATDVSEGKFPDDEHSYH